MNIYFCGSMTLDHSKKKFYAKIINYLGNYGRVLNKFVGEDFVDISPNETFKRDTHNLDSADILIADISIASLGVGFELGYFSKLNKPILLIYDEEKLLPSSLVRGIPNAIVKSYNNFDEVKIVIDKFIK